MADIKEFVINDRRKFTPEGDLRPDAPPSEPRPPRPESQREPEPESSARLVETPAPQPEASTAESQPPAPSGAASAQTPSESGSSDDELPPAPTTEQSQQATRAYDATVDRLDTAIRATNPGMERLPEMTFERVVQSLYMQAILQLGGGVEPGQQPQVDLLGARQTIDMLAVIAAKTQGNLSDSEARLIDSALFESRMGFLEVTQALARQSQTRPPGTPGAAPPPGGGPRIVR